MANGRTHGFITPKEVAADLRVEYQSFLRKLKRGEGPKFKRYGHLIKIRSDWYEAWLNEPNQPRKR